MSNSISVHISGQFGQQNSNSKMPGLEDCDEEHEGLIEYNHQQKTHKPSTINYIQHETTYEREDRVKNAENKFNYVNMICEDLNSMAKEQNIFINNINNNYADGYQNTKQGTEK